MTEQQIADVADKIGQIIFRLETNLFTAERNVLKLVDLNKAEDVAHYQLWSDNRRALTVDIEKLKELKTQMLLPPTPEPT